MACAGSASAKGDTAHLAYDYRHYSGRDWQFFEPVFARMRPAPPVLDVGSGLGLFLDCSKRHGTPAVGIESSKEGVEECARKGLPVVRGDITIPFPFKDAVYGSALVHHVLEHISLEKERFVLKEIFRVLRDGGFVMVVSPNVFDPGATVDPDHINLFSPHQLKKELRDAGFSKISLATNYWRPIRRPSAKPSRLGGLLSGVLWKVLPLDRFAGSSSAIAWKNG
jgi:SAM-dependent methyltransferase